MRQAAVEAASVGPGIAQAEAAVAITILEKLCLHYHSRESGTSIQVLPSVIDT